MIGEIFSTKTLKLYATFFYFLKDSTLVISSGVNVVWGEGLWIKEVETLMDHIIPKYIFIFKSHPFIKSWGNEIALYLDKAGHWNLDVLYTIHLERDYQKDGFVNITRTARQHHFNGRMKL